ncbi:uncharacterized protein LOC125230908 [Leguminivora glycinivorella]|uniref:uncharacterized protein LOC125230908 n=1 Tax=Leguminivora glycinivorella TaxID=1035111 RepID=UPI00200BD362|nr:uncharacterized protein LOC125230908 [Leguminivora glycinivorella]
MVCTTDERRYNVDFSGSVDSCGGFDNNVIQCETFELAPVDGKDGELGLQGDIELSVEIEDGTMVKLEVWKISDMGNEYMYRAQGDICGSLKDENAPWFPVVAAMNISECPIPVKSYAVKDMTLDLKETKEMLTHDMCGDYMVMMMFTTKDNDDMSCHEIGVSISEYTCDGDEK